MSAQLEEMAKRASQTVITDPDHIDAIVRYVLSREISYFRKDKIRYEYLCDNLSAGFGIDVDSLSSMTVANVLMLIGYEPGNQFFNSPLIKEKGYDKRFNSAGDCRSLGVMMYYLSGSGNIRIREFMHIGLEAYTKYLHTKVREEFEKCRITRRVAGRMMLGIDSFRSVSNRYIDNSDGTATIGTLIDKAVNHGIRCWVCSAVPLEDFSSGIIESYDILRRLFMDGIRMPLVIGYGREQFKQLIYSCAESPLEKLGSIDFTKCYEPTVG